MAIGIAVLANTRPYEGFVLSSVSGVILLIELFRRLTSWRLAAVRIGLPMLIVLGIVAIGMGYYFWRITGNPFLMPYSVNREQYSANGYFVWQAPGAIPVYHHKVIADFYLKAHLPYFLAARSLGGFVRSTLVKVASIWLFFVGPALTIPLFALPWTLRDKRIRPLVITIGVSFVAVCMSPFFFPHYFAPVAPCILAVTLQSMRHQRLWIWEGRPIGEFLVRSAVLICVLMIFVRAAILWGESRSGQRPPEMVRQDVLLKLESLPGPQLALVRYSQNHGLLAPDWVDNGADIDGSKVVWARDMGREQNQELLDYFHDRTFWLVEPDENPPKVLPYPEAR